MHILVLASDYTLYTDELLKLNPSLQLIAGDKPSNLIDAGRKCSIWLGDPHLVAELLRFGVKPKWIQSTWAGITPLIADDLSHDYILTRAVGVFGQLMAEYLLTYFLAHERQLIERIDYQKEGKWYDRQPGTLKGRQIMIVGAGEIGCCVAQMLVPFGVNLIGITNTSRSISPFHQCGTLEDLPRFLETVDYVVNLLPNTPQTQNIWNATLFAQMKPTAIFINAGRGSAVVDADLITSLEQKQLAGAVIDVCRKEPLPSEHPFWRTQGLLLTSHSAAPSLAYAIVELFCDNLNRFCNNLTMRGRVDFDRGY
ncbi:unnamed protein product [Adineta steineri]|uniref:D-isomer specific 2-hydroxyacid dehydrogenase NAD-binding domain-containing protein n=2 Tax=Adineta steineri TaxID=433720 RepID=A0A820DVG6_9BILA|nr:unnamed protein product [Adineta steineri]